MKSGVLVLGVFALLWAGAAIVFGAGWPLWLVALPIAVSASLYLWASRSPEPARSPEDEKRIGRAVGIWSAVEGVAIPVAVIVLDNVGAAHAIPPAIAIIVGLHFFPLARAFPRPLYNWTGAGLVLTGGAGLLLPVDQRLPVIGALSALLLWASAAILIVQSRRAASA